MKLELFDYAYPEESVAQEPLAERSQSRLCVLNPEQQSWTHHRFDEFPNFFEPGTVFIFNDAGVLPARFYGVTEQGRKVEVLLLQARDARTWNCLVRPANKLPRQTRLNFSKPGCAERLSAELVGAAAEWVLRFEMEPTLEVLQAFGLPPLPPYIKRADPWAMQTSDRARYQTVYAQQPLAAAAPTAGLHFTPELMARLTARGGELHFVTLEVGRDTFQPVRSEDITEHRMHGERYHVSEATAIAVNRAKAEGRNVVAIGTTSVRALESAWQQDQGLQAGTFTTQAFFYPGYQFKVIDALLTNFHQPKSTLLMLVSAFAGREFVLSAYQAAIAQGYRLFSFGDAMLILNAARS